MEIEEEDLPLESDHPWKLLLDVLFKESVALFHPAIYQLIDWEKPVISLDKELQKLAYDSVSSDKRVDKLVQVSLLSGQEALLLIHVEVQQLPEAGFTKRMYIYHSRINEHWQLPVFSFAIVLEGWKTKKSGIYSYELGGCKLHFEFPVCALASKEFADLSDNNSPIALAIQIQQTAVRTRKKSLERAAWKFEFIKRCYERGYERDYILLFLRFMDWILRLPKELEVRYMEQVLDLERNQKMPLLANFEIEAIEKGKAEGIEIGQSRGIEIGQSRGIEIGKSEIVLRMHGKGLSVDEIADLTGLSVAQIAAIVNPLSSSDDN